MNCSDISSVTPECSQCFSVMDTAACRTRQYVRPLFWLSLLLLSFFLASQAYAQAEVAAKVHFASGYVTATASSSDVRQIAKGDDVNRGDRIDTQENARVQMRFTDGSLVSLQPRSTFSVDDYVYDDSAADEASLVFGLLRGGLRTVTGAIGKTKHDQYELKTPVATLGIRGTEYVAVLQPANTLRVHVGRGKVVITNDQGSLEVPEGKNAVVTLGGAPELSDQGPEYQATGPGGDNLTVSEPSLASDPLLLDPRADMPPLGPDSFTIPPLLGGSGTGTGTGTGTGSEPPYP